MKKNLFIASMITGVLLLNGCATAPAQSTETISNQDFSNLHEQLENLQTDVSHYINTPSASDYKILSETEMKPTLQRLSSSLLLLQLDNLTDVSYKDISVNILFYDKDNKLMGNSFCYMDTVLAGKTMMSSIYYSMDNNASVNAEPVGNESADDQPITYDHYDLQVKALPIRDTLTDYSDQIEAVSNANTDQSVIAKIINNSDETLNSVSTYVLYKDADGNIIDCQSSTLYNLLPGSYDVATYAAPYDTDYNNISYDSYSLVIASAINTEAQFPTPQPQPKTAD